VSGVAEAGTLAFFREARFESDFTVLHLLLHLDFIRDHYRLRRRWVELYNSRDNNNNDGQRIYYAYPDSYSNANAYSNSHSDTIPNANTRDCDYNIGR
jgi:hypothetical protein